MNKITLPDHIRQALLERDPSIVDIPIWADSSFTLAEVQEELKTSIKAELVEIAREIYKDGDASYSPIATEVWAKGEKYFIALFLADNGKLDYRISRQYIYRGAPVYEEDLFVETI